MFTSAGGNGYIGCCPIDGPFDQCGFRTNCIDAAEFKNGTFCDSGCLHDTYTLKWFVLSSHLKPTTNPPHSTESSAPYCAALTWPVNGVADYFCDNDRITTTQTLYTSYNGQTGSTWFTTTISSSSLTSSHTTNVNDNGSNAPQPTSDSSAADANPSSGSGSDTGSSNNHTTSTKKKTPVGPIVGGVIGGLAVLAALGILIFFLVRRKRAAAASAANAPAAAEQTQGPLGPVVGPQGPPAYIPDANKPPLNPNTNSYYGPQSPQNGAFAAGGQYPPEMQQQQQYPQQPQPQQQGGGYYDPNTGAYYTPLPPQQGSPNPTSPTTTVVSGQTNDVISAGGNVRDSSATGSTGAYGYTSPRPGFSEMSANMAGGPFPSDQHEGTYEVEGSRPAVGAPAGGGGITELPGAHGAGGR